MSFEPLSVQEQILKIIEVCSLMGYEHIVADHDVSYSPNISASPKARNVEEEIDFEPILSTQNRKFAPMEVRREEVLEEDGEVEDGEDEDKVEELLLMSLRNRNLKLKQT